MQQADGFWVLSRYADVVAVYRDPDRFTSVRGNLLTALQRGGDPAGGRMIVVSDGPRHAAVRRLLASSLGPRTMQRLEATVAATTHRLLDASIDSPVCDFARDVAAHIPLWTICDLLGVPEADRAFVQHQTNLALGSENPAQSAIEIWAARNEILLYFRELARRGTADGLLGVLAAGRIDGDPLDEDEVVLNCYSLILGGDETARMSMSGMVAAFAREPAEWRRWCSGEVGIASAVDEVLRWTTPALHVGRTAVVDADLHGEHIRAGDVVTAWNVSANRDEREFDQPDVFDLGRTPNRHVTFGYGSHFCLGAALARMEISVLAQALRTRVAAFELAGTSHRIYSNFLSGSASLPIALIPR
jgi:cytochrome P450